MKLGVFSFNTEYTMRADRLAIEAEKRGFESVWFPEHTHIPASRKTEWPAGGELPKEYIHMSDPFASSAAAAAVTTTLKIGTGVSLIPQHEPLALAKTVATIDRLSDGRFLLGVGAGWNEDEMNNHGVQYNERWKVCIEHIEAMKALWTQEEASYHGKYVDFDKVWSYPKPVQQPHPPIILGSFASKFGRERAAKYADGWIPIGVLHENFEGDMADMHEQLKKVGRDPADFPISMFYVFEPSEDEIKGLADSGLFERAIPRCPTEDDDSVLRWLDKWAKVADGL